MNRVESLYRIYHQDIFRYVRSHVQNTELAQDITQDTFVRACDNLHIMEQPNNHRVKAWLMTVARNLCIDYWRKIQHESKNLDYEDVNDHDCFFSENDPLQSIESKEIKRVIRTAIKSLKLEHRQAICLFDLRHFTYKESAHILGISEVAFASLLKRARKAFINELMKIIFPNLEKDVISEREVRKLVYWFDILDLPINLEEKVSYKSRDFFNGFNERFDFFRRDSYPEALNDYLISTVQLEKHHVVADIGCGTGSLTFKLSPQVKKVYAIDHSPEMLNILNQNCLERQSSNVQPILADVASDFSLPAAAFDIGFCCMVLHHIYDPKAALQKIAKTIVPGGHLIIADLAYTNLNWKFKEAHDFWSGFKVSQMSKWLEDSGFKLLNIEENKEYCFSFSDIKNEAVRIEVPLLYAHCVRE